jgi:hypothetical protein
MASVKPYLPVSAELTILNSVLLRGGRIVIPPPGATQQDTQWTSGNHEVQRVGEAVNLVTSIVERVVRIDL